MDERNAIRKNFSVKNILFIILCFLLLSGCSLQSGQLAPLRHAQYLTSTPSGYYRVKPGDTLYSIAWRFGLDYRSLAVNNGITAPYILAAGQQLRIRGKSPRLRSVAIKKPINKPTIISTPRQTKVIQREIILTNKIDRRRVSKWYWPAQGRIVQRFNPKNNQKGIDITARFDSPVRATAAGMVVYSGTGLASYGHLIIIKHNAEYLSAYAFNHRVFVKEGQLVKAHQIIATMGRNNSRKILLHFELRRAGKPVNPLVYLH